VQIKATLVVIAAPGGNFQIAVSPEISAKQVFEQLNQARANSDDVVLLQPDGKTAIIRGKYLDDVLAVYEQEVNVVDPRLMPAGIIPNGGGRGT
jgi:hypothetical protein